MKSGRGRGVIALTLFLLLAQAGTAVAIQPAPSSAPVETATNIEATFPQGMTFSASIPLPSPGSDIDAVQLLYRIGSDPTLNLDIVPPTDFRIEGGSVEIATFVDFLAGFVPLGVDLTFSWEVMLADGSVVESVEEMTQWIDTRFDWDLRSSDQVRLYTYGASDDFAETMLQEAQATIDSLESTYSLDAITPVSIWVYPSYGDFHGTLQGNSRESIAGLTYLGLDTIIGIVPDGDEAEFLRVIPHEISHQVLSAATENPFGPPPLWFNEGMATHTQVGGTTFYGEMVANAHADGTLFDIQSLNSSFPYQPRQATLAYASSWSIVSYIETMWGAEGIARLIEAFGSGLPVDDAVTLALDVSMDELNEGWKAWIDIGAPVD